MFKRGMLVLLSLCVSCMFFAGCKKAENAPAEGSAQAGNEVVAPAGEAAAPTAEAAPAGGAVAPTAGEAAAPTAPAAAPAGDGVVPPTPVAGEVPPPEPLPPVPPEAQAAVDKLLDVLGSIAEAGKKESCADVLAELKKLDTPETKAKLEASLILQKYPEDVQRAINQANQSRMIGVAFEMAAYQKCKSTPENDAIDAMIKQLLAPIAPDEAEAAPADAAPTAAAPAADAAPTAAAPAADAAPTAEAAPTADATK